jgi:multidrug transporter EmrE-like cation transporter
MDYVKYKWLFMASFFSALTIIALKYYSLHSNYYWLLVTFLSEMGLIYSYIQLLQKSDIITGFSLVKIISILLVLLPSLVLLNVKLTTDKIAGILFAIMAMYLLV